MVKKFLKIAGVKNEQEFYKKYPTESAFFKAHPEAKTLAKMAQGGYINKALPFVPHAPVMYAQGGVLPMFQQKGKYDDYQGQDDMDQYTSSLGKGAPQMVGPQQPFVAPKPNYGVVGPKQQFGMVGPQQSYGMVGPHIPLPAYTPEPQEPDYGMTGPVQQFGMVGPSRPASTYTGTSVVDYLKSTGAGSDINARRKLAESKGIKNYTGSYDQNVALLDILRGGKGVMPSTPTVRKQKAKAPAVVTSKRSTPSNTSAGSDEEKYDPVQEAYNKTFFSKGTPTTDAEVQAYVDAGKKMHEWAAKQDKKQSKSLYKFIDVPGYANKVLVNHNEQYYQNQEFPLEYDYQHQPYSFLPPTSKNVVNYTDKIKQEILGNRKKGGQVLNNRAEINNIYAQGGEAPDGRALVNAYAEGGGYPYIGIPYHNYDMPMAYAYGGMYQMGGAPQQVDGQAQQSQGGGGQDQQIAQVVMQRLQEREQPEQILKDLVKAGVDDKKAVAIVQAVMQQMQQAGGGQQQAQQMQMARHGGAMYQSGGYVAGQEYDMDDEEIQRLKSLGYGIEYRD